MKLKQAIKEHDHALSKLKENRSVKSTRMNRIEKVGISNINSDIKKQNKPLKRKSTHQMQMVISLDACHEGHFVFYLIIVPTVGKKWRKRKVLNILKRAVQRN